MAESASSAKATFGFLIVRWRLRRAASSRPVAAARRPGSGHPWSPSAVHEYHRLDPGWSWSVCARAEPNTVPRQRDPGWACPWIQGSAASLNPRPAGGYGRRRSPSTTTCWWWPWVFQLRVGVRIKGMRRQLGQHGIISNYSHGPQIANTWERYAAFKVLRLFSATLPSTIKMRRCFQKVMYLARYDIFQPPKRCWA